MRGPYCVYILRDPRNNLPLYVGYGQTGLRPRESARYPVIPELKEELHTIRSLGLEPKIEVVAYFAIKEQARRAEIRLIRQIGWRQFGTGPLCNRTDTGSAPGIKQHSLASRRQISAVLKGRVKFQRRWKEEDDEPGVRRGFL
jgi:hypothetical protein